MDFLHQQQLQSSRVACGVHRNVSDTWRLLLCLLQPLGKEGFGQVGVHLGVHQVGPDVEKVLRHYVQLGAATVLPWQLPLKSQVKVQIDEAPRLNIREVNLTALKSEAKVRTEAQFTALNDCNLRLVRVAKYAVMVVS